jgi:hypothetical protein
MLVGIWLLPNDLVEDPTPEWLRIYLTNKDEHVLYDAWSKVRVRDQSSSRPS